MASNQPPNASLGDLVVLPREIRQTIFAIVFDSDEPILIRRCCGLVAGRKLCFFHKIEDYPSRFALENVSREVRQDALMVIYSRIPLHLDFKVKMTTYTAANTAQLQYLWRWVTNFRVIELGLTERLLDGEKPEIYTEALRKAVEKIVDHKRPTFDELPKEFEGRRVTLHLGTMFDEICPFNVVDSFESAATMTGIQYSMPIISWQNLEAALALIVADKKTTEWTITAVTELDEDSRCGRQALTRLRTYLNKNEIKFVELSSSDDFAQDTNPQMEFD